MMRDRSSSGDGYKGPRPISVVGRGGIDFSNFEDGYYVVPPDQMVVAADIPKAANENKNLQINPTSYEEAVQNEAWKRLIKKMVPTLKIIK